MTLGITDLSVFWDQPAAVKETHSNREDASAADQNGQAAKQDEKQKNPVKSIASKCAKVRGYISFIHRYLKFIKLVDLSIRNISLEVEDIGTLYVRSFAFHADIKSADIRQPDVFSISCELEDTHDCPMNVVHWKFSVKDVFYRPHDKELREILDNLIFDLHDIFSASDYASTDVSMALRFGNFSIPHDSCMTAFDLIHKRNQRNLEPHKQRAKEQINELTAKDTCTPDEFNLLLQAAARLIGIVREVRFHATRIGVYELFPQKLDDKSVTFSLGTKDFTIDMRRLNPQSPGHRLLFSESDTSHQAIMTTISTAIGINSGKCRHDELLYIPMITMSLISNFLSKSIQFFKNETTDKNSSILKASLNVSSPSVDLHASYLPLLVSLCSASKSSESSINNPHETAIAKILPRATIKFTVEEPACRLIISDTVLQSINPSKQNRLVSTCSVINFELESSHYTAPTRYVLTTSLRVSDFEGWSRSQGGSSQQLMKTELLILKVIAETIPRLEVSVSGSLQTFSFFLTRPEIISSLNDLIAFARKGLAKYNDSESGMKNLISQDTSKQKYHANFIRRVPDWLSQVKFGGSDVLVCLSCTDPLVFNNARGVAVQIDSWAAEYRTNVESSSYSPHKHRHRRRESLGAYGQLDAPPVASDGIPTDRRRFAIGFKDFEACTVDASNVVDQETPILSIPDVEMAITTSMKGEVPVTDVNLLLKRASINYTLYTHYDILMALTAISKIFVRKDDKGHPLSAATFVRVIPAESVREVDIVNVEVRSQNIKFKAQLPGTPALFFETVGLDFTTRTYGIPIVKAKYVRLFVESRSIENAWERLICFQSFRLELKSQHGASGSPEKNSKSNAPQHSSGPVISDDHIVIDAAALSISIPFGFVLYRVFDGAVNSFKALKQLHHRYKTETEEYILTPHAQKPKRFPRIRLKPKMLEIRIDDDPFESKLSLIFRVGLLEAKARLAREAAYEAKVQTLIAAEEKKKAAANSSNIEKVKFDTKPAVPADTGQSSGDQPLSGRSDNVSPAVITPKSTLDQPSEESNLEALSSEKHKSDKGVSTDPTADHSIRKKGTFRSIRHSKRRRKEARVLRYSPTDAKLPSESSTISIENAYKKLQEHHSQAWIKRIRSAKKSYAKEIESSRKRSIGADDIDSETAMHERIVSIPNAPSLFQILLSDANILLDTPSYPIENVPKFLYDVGKGIPEDTKFSLLVPFYLQFGMSEGRVLLRDYPLPFLHVPPVDNSNSHPNLAWSLSSDFVIAEELCEEKSIRHVMVPIIPQHMGNKDALEYSIRVPRTVSPIKTYSRINVTINSTKPTRITWAPSIQPAIQQVMMIFDSFTKPPVDPSEKVGFWDKIRLIFHSRIAINWKDGDVHLLLKGQLSILKLSKVFFKWCC